MNVNINIIAAVADNLAIGSKGRLLWHISEDLKYFKKVTMGCPVIMGRRTFESLGRPLPGRLNIVVTRNAAAHFPETVVKAGSLEEAVEAAKKCISERYCTESEEGTRRTEGNVFVIGGAEIYRQTVRIADRLYITRIHSTPSEADAFFPQIDAKVWEAESRSELRKDPACGIDYEFVVYKRKHGD